MAQMKEGFCYKIFGMRIICDIELPELIVDISRQIPDVTIKKAHLLEKWVDAAKNNPIYIVERNLIMFKVPELAIFCIQDGNRINYSPLSAGNNDQIRLYILGTCMGALLNQRNSLPLHGSAVAINGKAYAIVGDSGAGKSTLASALINKGFPLLTDDVIALKNNKDGHPLVLPAYPQQKLWENSLKEFKIDSANLSPLFERETKFAVPIREQFFNKPLPLAGIFELVTCEGEKVKLDSMNPLERLHVLFQHTYRNLFIKRLGLREWHLQYTASFAKNIEMYRLTRPTSRFTASELATLIEETVLKEELVHD
ncbi:aldolase [Rossellomorea vietnamensis]|uniref:aldolase n=1 Tax=Rossellomorea vietnamensis TaxID=218284 RepID=UPI003D293568